MNASCACRRLWLSGVILICGLSGVAVAQERPVDFKSLYAAASYEEALAVLAPLDTVEAYQYKALCFLALGRLEDARAAVHSLVTASPTYVPSPEDAPPRLLGLIAETRRTLLPVIARQAFAEGREQFGAKRNDDAIRQFTLVLTLVADKAFEDAPTALDLKTLAQGFIDLAHATAPPPPPAAAPVAPAEPEPPPPVSPPQVTQAVALTQRIPGIPSEAVGRMAPSLSVQVEIDADGKVTSATIRQSAHPVYDRLVLQATRDWRYTPATINGRPIPSEQTVVIQTTRP